MDNLKMAESFAKELIAEYCPNYSFKWIKATTIHGQCSYDAKEIRLSKPFVLIATQDQLFNTLTHEIAHAMVGMGHGHNEYWRRTHIKLGGNGQRCSDVFVPRVRKNATWKLSCENKCWEIDYTRKPKTALRICRKCRGKLVAKEI